jgi:hypothetical protein
MVVIEQEENLYEEDSNVYILKNLRKEVENSFLYNSINPATFKASILDPNFSKVDISGDMTVIQNPNDHTRLRATVGQSIQE